MKSSKNGLKLAQERLKRMSSISENMRSKELVYELEWTTQSLSDEKKNVQIRTFWVHTMKYKRCEGLEMINRRLSPRNVRRSVPMTLSRGIYLASTYSTHSFAFSLLFSSSHCSWAFLIRHQLMSPTIPASGGQAQSNQLHHFGLLLRSSSITLSTSRFKSSLLPSFHMAIPLPEPLLTTLLAFSLTSP